MLDLKIVGSGTSHTQEMIGFGQRQTQKIWW
jgi:hypothetical protein